MQRECQQPSSTAPTERLCTGSKPFHGRSYAQHFEFFEQQHRLCVRVHFYRLHGICFSVSPCLKKDPAVILPHILPIRPFYHLIDLLNICSLPSYFQYKSVSTDFIAGLQSPTPTQRRQWKLLPQITTTTTTTRRLRYSRPGWSFQSDPVMLRPSAPAWM
jgi:hypothetical protein